MNTLIIDDDPQFRLALRHILMREGHAITEAEDGDVGLRMIAAQPFDLVLMDMVMPNKEGLETILEIRKSLPDLKIIAMSGGARFHSLDPLQLAQHCGANFIIAKPFQPSELQALVQQCLPGKKD